MDDLEQQLARQLANIAHNDSDDSSYVPDSAKAAAKSIRRMIELAALDERLAGDSL